MDVQKASLLYTCNVHNVHLYCWKRQIDMALRFTTRKQERVHSREQLWLWNPWGGSQEVLNWGNQWLHKMDLGPAKKVVSFTYSLVCWLFQSILQSFINPSINSFAFVCQLIWAKTRELGCGFQMCDELEDMDTGKVYKNAHHFVCNYYPGWISYTYLLFNIFWSFVIERPILADNPKAHFAWITMNNLCFSWKAPENVLSIWKAPEKQQKQLIQHTSLILTWSFIECRGKAN